ncbi:hypothetical protein C1H46_006384 [Malus baccata]|uniref:Uncharacterized protein n=1 Tax=Malus baccata TaxID=106549 RepID=A0A540NAA2_MALBA|nr:hypothetical protein C1H46_006384 [Malus baccata]
MSSRAVEDDALAKAAKAVEALYLLRDTYFPADPDDKISRLNTDSDLALNLLDSIPLDNLGNACLRSFFVTGAWEHSKLLQSLKAYQNAASA